MTYSYYCRKQNIDRDTSLSKIYICKKSQEIKKIVAGQKNDAPGDDKFFNAPYKLFLQ